MGYHRPVSHFNTGKRSEHFSRVHFDEEISLKTASMVCDNKKFTEEFSSPHISVCGLLRAR